MTLYMHSIVLFCSLCLGFRGVLLFEVTFMYSSLLYSRIVVMAAMALDSHRLFCSPPYVCFYILYYFLFLYSEFMTNKYDDGDDDDTAKVISRFH